MKILVIDVGGTHIKVLANQRRGPLAIPSGPTMTAQRMVTEVRKLVADWKYSAVSIGYPGPVVHGRPVCESHNLGRGWVGFDFQKAFGRPVKIINDATMQVLGSYAGGRMLFLGLSTGLGSALIVDGILEPMELAHLPYKKGRTYEDYVGLAGLKRLGKKKWRRHVADVIERLRTALQADYVVLGGGNAQLLKKLPPGTRHGNNMNAFLGGYRLWQKPNSFLPHPVQGDEVLKQKCKKVNSRIDIVPDDTALYNAATDTRLLYSPGRRPLTKALQEERRLVVSNWAESSYRLHNDD